MKQIVVISGKGGTGKTSITAALAGVGPNKVLADCDVDAADLHLVLEPKILESREFVSGELPIKDSDLCTDCGQCLEHCRFGAISETFEIMTNHCEGCGVCEFVCPVDAITMEPRTCGHQYRSATRYGTMIHAALGIGEENSGKLVTSVRNEATQEAEKEGVGYVLVDGSPGIGCPVIASLTDADIAVLVTEPTVSAIHDLKRIHALTKHFDMPCVAVINKTGVNPEQEQAIRDFCSHVNVPMLGEIPYDIKVTKAQIKGMTMQEYDPEGLGANVLSIWNNIESILENDPKGEH